MVKVLCLTEDEKNFVQAVCIANPGNNMIRILYGRDPQTRKAYRGNFELNDETLNQIKNRLGEKRVRVISNDIK